ncbi:MAG: hypothetical protein Q9168_004699 [Polycauliona sp. 1 TL-2023]
MGEIVEQERATVNRKWQANEADPILTKLLRYLDDVFGMLNQRGLAALASRSPIALYNVAQYRNTRNDKDRVYGIQQIFRFRLGESAPGCHAMDPKTFNRFNLEDQLGAALVENYPVASQLHNFTEPADEGTGWRISSSSIVPRLGIKTGIWRLQLHSSCKFSTEMVRGQRHAIFDGHVCSLVQLANSWKEMHHDPYFRNILGIKSPQQLVLDTVFHPDAMFRETIWEEPTERRYGLQKPRNVDDDPAGLVWGPASYDRLVPRGERQHHLTFALIRLIDEQFDGAPLVVLHLGHFSDIAEDEATAAPHDNYHVGLILTRFNVGAVATWKRLGICIWQYVYNGVGIESDACLRPDLQADGELSSDWTHLSDSFG